MRKGQHASDEARAKMSVAQLRRPATSPETRAKLSAAFLGRPLSPETRAKISAAHMGLKASPETLMKMKRRKVSSETCAKLSAALMGHSVSPATRAKHSAARVGYVISPETRMKMAAAMMGHKVSSETRAKISAADWKGGKQMSDHRHKAKRRILGFIPLNNPFAGCEGHHVDKERVINMLKTLHRSVPHRQSDGRGMAKMNAIAYNFLFKQEVEAAMTKVLA